MVGRLSRAFAAFCLVLTVAGVTGQAATRPAVAAPRAALATSVPTGRFHSLPPRTVGTVHLGANQSKQIRLAGKAGLPASNLLAASVTLRITKTGGPTRSRPMQAPSSPACRASPPRDSKPRRSPSFRSPPTGRSRLWNGAHAATVRIQTTGWFSSATVPDSDTSGLFTRLAGYKLASKKLKPGATTTVHVLGAHDVADAAISSILLRLRTTSAGIGAVGIGPTTAVAANADSLAYAAGHDTDLAVSRIVKGAVTLHNDGKKTVTVAVAAVGQFSSGADQYGFGDGLIVVDPVSVVSAAIGTAGSDVQTAGIGDVPSATTSSPPSLTLVRASASGATAIGGLMTDPTGSPSSGVEVLDHRKGGVAAGMLVVQPGQGDTSTFAEEHGQADVAAEAYGYFAGGTVIAAGFHRIDAGTAADITAVDATSVTFSGVPAALADIQVGDVFAGVSSVLAPDGLLRKVTGVTTPGGNLVLQTDPASLADVYQQGHLSIGLKTKTPVAKAAKAAKANAATAAARSGAGAPALVGFPGCGISGYAIGVTLSCAAEQATPSADVRVGASITADLQLSFNFGHDDWLYVRESATAAASVSVTSTSGSTQVSLQAAWPEGPVGADPPPVPFCTVVIPEILVELGCHPEIEVEASGNLEGTLSAEAHASGTVTDSLDSQRDRFAVETSSTHGGSGDATGHVDAAVKVSVVPQVTWKIDESPLGLHVGVPISVNLEYDECTIAAFVSIDAEAGVEVEKFHVGVDRSVSSNIWSGNAYQIPLKNCVYWTGHLDYDGVVHVTSPTQTQKFHTSASGILRQPHGIHDSSGNYLVPLTGSGALTLKDTITCGFNPQQIVINEYDYNWSGNVTYLGQTPDLSVGRVAGDWLFTMPSIGTNDLGTPGERTIHGWQSDLLGLCTQYDDGPYEYTEKQWQFTFAGADMCGTSLVCSQFKIHAPYGVMHSAGTRTVHPDGQSTFTFGWSLDKHCTIAKRC